jgi:carbonic anhydrase/acetyltransferase-like protein (isoleucine patch superfamily)
MNAAVLDHCVMEKGSLLASGGVLKERDRIPAWTLAAGVPAKPLRRLEGAALETLKSASGHYQRLMNLYEHLGRPV